MGVRDKRPWTEKLRDSCPGIPTLAEKRAKDGGAQSDKKYTLNSAQPEGPMLLQQFFGFGGDVLPAEAEFGHHLGTGSRSAEAIQTDDRALGADKLPPGEGRSGLARQG